MSRVQGDQVIVIGADHALCMKAINLSVSSCYQRCYVSTVLLCVDLCDQSVKQLIYSTMHYLSPFLSQHSSFYCRQPNYIHVYHALSHISEFWQNISLQH